VEEFFGFEGFWEEKFVGLEVHLAAHLVGVVAGGEDRFDIRAGTADVADEFAAAAVFEADIGDDQGDAVAGSFEKLQAEIVGG